MPSPALLTTISAWLAPIRDKIPADLDVGEAARLQQAITEEAISRLSAFLAGVKRYQKAGVTRDPAQEWPVLWQQGTTRLLDYAPASKDPVLFIVPSLVNRFDILDIDQDHSFLRHLAGAGFRPLVVDWGEPGEMEKAFSIEDYLEQRLLPAFAVARDEGDGGACPVLGYCMGGVLALALAQRQPESLSALVLLATPWDFSVGVGGVPAVTTPVGAAFLTQAGQWGPYLQKIGLLPASMLQSVFMGFQPLQVIEKFVRFASEPVGEGEARRFVLTEDWLNDGVPLAFPVAMECLRDWYGRNALMAKGWRTGGRPLDPSAISVPSLLVVAERDRIVPPASTAPLAQAIPDAALLTVPVGHIGLMASDSSPEGVWEPMLRWLRERDVAGKGQDKRPQVAL